MTKSLKLGLSILAGSAIALGAQAVPVTGSITFAGGVTLNTSSASTASEVMNWFGPGGSPNPIVISASGSFGTVAPLAPVTFSAPWFFNTTTPIANFWTVGGFSFQLLGSRIVSQTGPAGIGTVSVAGSGQITGNGYAPTTGTWTFTTSDPGALDGAGDLLFSFQAATGAVPEAGTTAMLLGLSLTALAIFAKFRKASVA